MVGVYDHTIKFCKKCNKETEHETGWESEEPDVMDFWCKECKTHSRS